MYKKKYKKLTLDFPAEEYVYLKMACAKQGVHKRLRNPSCYHFN